MNSGTLIFIAEHLSIAGILFYLLHFIQNKFALTIAPWLLILLVLALAMLSDSLVFQLCAISLFLISEIDRRERRIPDIFTKPAICVFAICYLENRTAIILAAFWLIAMYLLTQKFPSFIGRGDIKLVTALILLNEQFREIEPIAFLTVLLFIASMVGMPGALIARRRGISYPFAPALSVSALLLFI